MKLTITLMKMMATFLLVVDRLTVPVVYVGVDQCSDELCLILCVDEVE